MQGHLSGTAEPLVGEVGAVACSDVLRLSLAKGSLELGKGVL